MISFGPCVCGYEPVPPSCADHPWAVMAGYVDCVTFLDDDRRRRLSAVPSPGSTATVQIGYPFVVEIDAPFWCIFDPPRASLDGYLDRAEDLPGLRLVRACITEGPAGEWSRHEAYAKARVIEVVDPISLVALPPTTDPVDQIISRVSFHRPEIAVESSFVFKSSNIQGDLVSWIIMYEASLDASLLMFSESDHHESRFFAGNRPLEPDEVLALR